MNEAARQASPGREAARLGVPSGTAVMLLLLVAGAVSAALWQHWAGNPDLSHGMLMPLVFVYLIHEARSRGTQRFTAASPARHAAGALLGVAGLLLGLAGGLYAAALGWGHPLAAAFVGTGLSALLCVGLLSLSDTRLRLVPLNWQSLCAAGLWSLTVPLPPGAYSRLSGNLQQGVSQAVLLALNLLGIPATRQGNIIELAHSRVGVEEACSGVRSLIACIFVALLISALVLRSPWRRALLILVAPLLALAMNLLRSLVLTLAANAGIDINGTWHDLTGFGILAVTGLLLFGLAQLLGRRERNGAAARTGGQEHPVHASPDAADRTVTGQLADAPIPTPALGNAADQPPLARHCPWLLLGHASGAVLLALLLLSLQVFPRQPRLAGPPDLEAAIPRTLSGWEQQSPADLQRFAKVLGTNRLVERSYQQGTGSQRVQVTVYAAAWAAGEATPAQVSLHTPEVCWPGAGWTQLPGTPATTPALPAGAHALGFRSPSGATHQVVYWLLYDGDPVGHLDPYSPPDLLRLALRYGHRAPAPQVFVRISGNRPHAELLRLPPVRASLRALGISDL